MWKLTLHKEWFLIEIGFWLPDVHWQIFSHFLFSQDGRRLQAGFWGQMRTLLWQWHTHTHTCHIHGHRVRGALGAIFAHLLDRSRIRPMLWQQTWHVNTRQVTLLFLTRCPVFDKVSPTILELILLTTNEFFWSKHLQIYDWHQIFLQPPRQALQEELIYKINSLEITRENVRDWVLSYIHILPRYKVPAETPRFFSCGSEWGQIIMTGWEWLGPLFTFMIYCENSCFWPDPIYW